MALECVDASAGGLSSASALLLRLPSPRPLPLPLSLALTLSSSFSLLLLDPLSEDPVPDDDDDDDDDDEPLPLPLPLLLPEDVVGPELVANEDTDALLVDDDAASGCDFLVDSESELAPCKPGGLQGPSSSDPFLPNTDPVKSTRENRDFVSIGTHPSSLSDEALVVDDGDTGRGPASFSLIPLVVGREGNGIQSSSSLLGTCDFSELTQLAVDDGMLSGGCGEDSAVSGMLSMNTPGIDRRFSTTA
mmetsp:Transcript_4743/g.13666  ORF Transcript_4743/g.13666 Transcript_4743/m.13666 type:complete len:247 (+) Transcript_4743:684-1424(+)